MNQLHIKNHFVPECYLKRWSDSEDKVWTYKTLVSHPNFPTWKRYSTSAIAYQKHLYTQIISEGETDEFETWLDQEFESPANPILDKVVLENKLTPNDWNILIKFLAAQDVRTPARLLEYLDRAEKTTSEILHNVMDGLKEKLVRSEIQYNSVKKELRPSENIPLKLTTHFEKGTDESVLKAETYIGRRTWIYSMRHLLENTSKILHNHKWCIIKPAKGYFWPTSDNPVVKLNYYGQNKYDFNGGWGVKKGNIFFPIGPEHAMFVEIGDKPLKKNTRLSIQETNTFIKYVSENSHRKIFSHYNDGRIPTLRKRIVDSERLTRENMEMKNWHLVNAQIEQEYISNIRNPRHENY